MRDWYTELEDFIKRSEKSISELSAIDATRELLNEEYLQPFLHGLYKTIPSDPEWIDPDELGWTVLRSVGSVKYLYRLTDGSESDNLRSMNMRAALQAFDDSLYIIGGGRLSEGFLQLLADCATLNTPVAFMLTNMNRESVDIPDFFTKVIQLNNSSCLWMRQDEKSGTMIIVDLGNTHMEESSSADISSIVVTAMTAFANHRREYVSTENSVEAVELAATVNRIKSEYAKLTEELNALNEKIGNREQEITQSLSTYSSMLRVQQDDRLRVQRMPLMLAPMAIDFARLGEGVKGALASDRRVINDSWDVTSSLIKFSTHPYVMKSTYYEWCDECDSNRRSCDCHYDDDDDEGTAFVRIPSIRYEININNGYNSDCVRVYNNEEDPYSICHPHVQDSMPCLGDAGLGVAEAWARRDWESVVTILLAWHAIYNDDSPYYPINQNESSFDGAGGPARWLVQTVEQVTPEEVIEVPATPFQFGGAANAIEMNDEVMF